MTLNACVVCVRVFMQQGLAFHRSSDWGLAYVGAFIFLRFFCPAIVSPKPHGIVKRTHIARGQCCRSGITLDLVS
jgi:hypothetical protein